MEQSRKLGCIICLKHGFKLVDPLLGNCLCRRRHMYVYRLLKRGQLDCMAFCEHFGRILESAEGKAQRAELLK